jgi:hypothetical protein
MSAEEKHEPHLEGAVLSLIWPSKREKEREVREVKNMANMAWLIIASSFCSIDTVSYTTRMTLSLCIPTNKQQKQSNCT